MLKGMSTTTKAGLAVTIIGLVTAAVGCFIKGSNNTDDSTANASNEPASAAATPAMPTAPASPTAE